MSKDEFKIAEADSPTPAQVHLLMDNGGCEALARLIAGHIKRGLESGAWIIADGRAIPVAMLHFYEENGTMAEEETCEPIAR